jgi:hypothetical protein
MLKKQICTTSIHKTTAPSLKLLTALTVAKIIVDIPQDRSTKPTATMGAMLGIMLKVYIHLMILHMCALALSLGTTVVAFSMLMNMGLVLVAVPVQGASVASPRQAGRARNSAKDLVLT